MARVLAVLSLVLARYRYGLLACLIYTVAFFQAGIHVLYVYIDLGILLRAYHCRFPYCVQGLCLVLFLYCDTDLITCRIFYFRRVCALCPALEDVARSYRLAVGYFKYRYSVCRSLFLYCRYRGYILSVSVILQAVSIILLCYQIEAVVCRLYAAEHGTCQAEYALVCSRVLRDSDDLPAFLYCEA